MIQYFNPIAWMRWSGRFVSGWFLSLPLREIPKTIPAIILLVLFFVCLIAAQSRTSSWRGRLLDRQMISAFERDDYGTAELVLVRKLRLTPDDTDLTFRLGVTKDALGEEAAATDIMRTLVGQRRNERAARWLLQERYIGSKWSELSIEEQEEFGDLLALISREAPKDMRIRQLYADYLIADGQLNKAIPLLDDLARIQPMRGLQAAAIARQLGNDATADRLARRTLENVNKLLEEDPSNAEVTLAVAQNQLFLKRYGECVRTIEQGIKLAKKDEEKRKLSIAMGDCIVAWVGFIESTPTEGSKDRLRVLKMLQVALKYAPNNPRVLTLVADQVLSTMNEDDKQIAALRKSLVTGSSPGIAHFIRGTAALMNDEVEKATVSLELAAKELPRSSAILNNLAVALSMKDDTKLEQALKISNQAISSAGNITPHFFETRGQILVRLGRHLEAIPDLEKAVSVPTLAKQAHDALAVCYDKINEPELAQMHRDASENPDTWSTDEESAETKESDEEE